MHACDYELFVVWVWYLLSARRSFVQARAYQHARGTLCQVHIYIYIYIICIDTVVLPTVNLLTNHDYLLMQQQ